MEQSVKQSQNSTPLIYATKDEERNASTSLFHMDEVSAHMPFAVWQHFFVGIIVGLLIAGSIKDWQTTLTITGLCFILIFGAIIVFKSLFLATDLFAKNRQASSCDYNHIVDFPTYSVLIPLYQEANMISQLMQGLLQLDYPQDKLDIILLLEQDDVDTIRTYKKYYLENNDKLTHIRGIVVPNGTPRTKPKALNVALNYIVGKYVVVYDAEDIPESDQLKKAVAMFQNSDKKTVCLQASLCFRNSQDNWLTRMFTLEYDIWFRHFLPNIMHYGLPAPLGGTSMHLKTKALKLLCGWDSYNVTEDCDLGLRIYRCGWSSKMLSSVTYEEANNDIINWIKQRTRWLKGYLHTWFSHMRHPFKLLSDSHFWGWFGVQAIILGTFLSAFLTPPVLIIYITWLITKTALFDPIFNIFSGFHHFMWWGGIALPVLTAIIAAKHTKKYYLIFWSFTYIFYQALAGLSALRAIWQIIFTRSEWEKTKHGLEKNKNIEDLFNIEVQTK